MKEIAGVLGIIFGALAFGVFISWCIPLMGIKMFGSLYKLKSSDGKTYYKWGSAVEADTLLSELNLLRNTIILAILSGLLLHYSLGG